ncbi:MAG: multicopper oxidase family protein [Pseudomonadota bacterium]
MDRRAFLGASASLAGVSSIPHLTGCNQVQASAERLVVEPSAIRLFDSQPGPTKVWTYNGQVAGPTLRMRQGEMYALDLFNKIGQPTSLHWHGLRVPFEMDGVGSITQNGISPGQSFRYAFAPPDAGLFWYHPHMNSEEQVAKGMFGLILIEERNPPPVDREVVWSLYDWGLDDDYQVPGKKAFQIWRGEEVYAKHSAITTDGQAAPDLEMRRGERVRLRIANTSGNRRYALKFEGHNPWVIAWDSNGVIPYQLGDQPLIIGTGARVDLILDGTGEVGQVFEILDLFNRDFEPVPPWESPEQTAARAAERVTRIRYLDTPAVRPLSELPPPTAPIANPIPVPDLSAAELIEIELGQSMIPVREIPKIGPMAAVLAEEHGVSMDTEVGLWTMNGEVLLEDLETYNCIDPVPAFECKIGRTYKVRFKNATHVDHPMHLHGHTFQMISRNGLAYDRVFMRDTFTLFADETVEIAFVADNIGDWMIHCHRGMHQHGGMMSTFRVT